MKPAISPPAEPGRRESWWINGILAAALLHGLIYVFLMPPWQHYEEPSHFEYAWLIASQRRLPPQGTFDNAIRRELASSMVEHNFFRDLDFAPDLGAGDDPIWIGQSVVGGAPLYHVLVSVPLALSRPLGVTGQLYAARLFSLAFFLASIYVSYKIVSDLTQPGNFIRWAVPGSLALLPGFTDLMTALNNDVGATLFFSLFLCAGVRLISRGVSSMRLFALTAATLLCVATKNTVLVAVPLAVLALGAAVFRTARRGMTWALLGLLLALIFGLGAGLSWGDAAGWYRNAIQSEATRTPLAGAPVGNHAIQLRVAGESYSAQLRQILPADQIAGFQGRSATLGAWIWASTPLQIAPLRLDADAESFTQSFQLGTEPAFYSFQTALPEGFERLDIVLHANRPAPDGADLTVYFDGLVLVPGEWPLAMAPSFLDGRAAEGAWGAQSFTNAIRNASGERAWLWVRPWAEGLFRQVAEAHLSPSRLLASLQDWQVTRQLYIVTGWNLFQTFWARFGWGQVFLPAFWYWLLAAASLAGVGLSLPVFWRYFKNSPRPRRMALIWLGAAGLTIWASALLRGFFTVPLSRLYVPTARYAYPAITPTLMLLTAGAASLAGLLRRFRSVLFFAGFLVLDVISLATIYSYYR